MFAYTFLHNLIWFMHPHSREGGFISGQSIANIVVWAQVLQAVSVLIKGVLGVAEQVSGLIRGSTMKATGKVPRLGPEARHLGWIHVILERWGR